MHPALRRGVPSGIPAGFNRVRGVERFAPPTGRNLPQALRALPSEALTPQDHALTMALKPLGKGSVRLALGGRPHDPAAEPHWWGRPRRLPPWLHLLRVFGAQAPSRGGSRQEGAKTDSPLLSSYLLDTTLADSLGQSGGERSTWYNHRTVMGEYADAEGCI